LTISAGRGDKATEDVPETSSSGALAIPSWGSPEYTAMLVANPARLLEWTSAADHWSTESLHLPAGWIWDLERRKQWQRALQFWQTIENVVILVDLPPMSEPETVLYAENMPNLVWLAESHKADSSQTLEQLETLRNARCHLVGAVLNRHVQASVRPRFARWFGRKSLIIGTAFGLMGAPASAEMAPTGTRSDLALVRNESSFSAPDSMERASWQRRFVLGPGDLLNLSVFGQVDANPTAVPIGPDGRISYLEAQNILAAGLTVDEFRAELNRELTKFRNAPEVIVRPAAYRSKKYYILGAVVKKGAFPFVRPITIIEAVAQAQGLETQVIDRSQLFHADLTSSFIARKGVRLPVDFKKLFMEGDLSQNIALEPDDYLYFPPGERAQIFVLGEVRAPGAMIAGTRTSALEAIAVRGGFSEKAWQKRLLVIRGSLQKPQTFIVNASDILAAKSPDFQLQPKDIIYVSSRPWYKVEELLDIAASAFVQSAVVTKTGLSITPILGN
jgi:protein involved in polysaccharide export with SLBB domain